MDNKLILHIGMTKTGSTAIQRYLTENEVQLVKQGFQIAASTGLIWPPMPEYDGWEDQQVAIEDGWKPIRDCLKTGYDVIVSDETLIHSFAQAPRRLQDIMSYIGNVPIVIVLYLRRQDLHAESIYKEIIKQHEAPTPFCENAVYELCGSNLYDYHQLTLSLGEHIGLENVRLRVYERDRFPHGDIVQDFCQTIGIAYDNSVLCAPKNDNPSVDSRMVEYFSAANSKWPVHNDTGHTFNDLLIQCSKTTLPDFRKQLFDDQSRKAFMQRHEASNRRLAQDILGLEAATPFAPLAAKSSFSNPKGNHHAEFLLSIHDAWSDGFGAIPLPIYNYRKMLHLNRRREHSLGSSRLLLGMRYGLHWSMHATYSLLTGKKFHDEYFTNDKFPLHYILRDKRLTANKTTAS